MTGFLAIAMGITLVCTAKVVFRKERSKSRRTVHEVLMKEVLMEEESSLLVGIIYILLGLAGLLYCLHSAVPDFFEVFGNF